MDLIVCSRNNIYYCCIWQRKDWRVSFLGWKDLHIFLSFDQVLLRNYTFWQFRCSVLDHGKKLSCIKISGALPREYGVNCNFWNCNIFMRLCYVQTLRERALYMFCVRSTCVCLLVDLRRSSVHQLVARWQSPVPTAQPLWVRSSSVARCRDFCRIIE